MRDRIVLRTYGDPYVREPNECKELNEKFKEGYEIEYVTPMNGYIEYILSKFEYDTKDCDVKEDGNDEEEKKA